MSKFEVRQRERDVARKAAIAARLVEKEKESRTEETSKYFTEQFSLQKTAIEDLLEIAKSVPKDGLPEHFDLISKDCHSLQRLVSDATLYLTAFELRTAQEQIRQLQTQIVTTQDQLLPKKKFSFKSHPKKPSPAKSSPDPIAPPPPPLSADTVNAQSSPLGGGQNLKGFRGKENELLSLSSDEIRSHDINLSDLKDCEVKLFGSPVTLHMRNMDNCCVLCGPVSSSVFVDSCKNCTFVVACQQLRVHTTVRSVFYLHVTSKAIIEDCTQLQFTPYNLRYPELQTHFQESGLSEVVNNWSDVDDFNWLVLSTPSPNWTILPSEERKTWD